MFTNTLNPSKETTMTNPDYTHITLVVDRSGSMTAIKTETEGGVNDFIAEQKKLPGKTTLTLSTFDTHFDIVHDHVDINEVPPFVLDPRGFTALFDAMGKSIHETGAWLATLPEDERPGKVIFVTVTDGQENASREFTQQTVFAAVTEQTNTYAWEFSFLAADPSAIKVGTAMGINPNNSMAYDPNNIGATFNIASASVARSRQGQDRAYTEAERSAAVNG
jgi:uncharacterized protein YegL